MAHRRRFAAVFPDAHFVEVPDALTFVSLDAPRAVVEEIITGTTRSAT
ncbi:hypothetical protein [Gordonia jinghuaiqii]|nr:hypothetical protein [Gordonia jinghuaiqii]